MEFLENPSITSSGDTAGFKKDLTTLFRIYGDYKDNFEQYRDEIVLYL